MCIIIFYFLYIFTWYFILGRILSDQCEYSIKIASYNNKNNSVFKSHKEFTGSILSSLDESYAYLLLNNNNKSTFKGIERIDKLDYPNEVLREALINAIVHRSYSFSGSIIININPFQIEFISTGGLISGLTKEDIMQGISEQRNKKLAELFLRLNYIESYGTGIKKYLNHMKSILKSQK